ncbi:MAG: hypothetical protein ABSF26_21510 [Thermoguttaceae bacterium]|jgi:hypothetical protein
MNVEKAPTKMAVSVSEMAAMCNLSRSRFYVLLVSGTFPRPVQNASCKRPHYALELQAKCLEIRRTGIGFNGLPVLFNRKAGPPAKTRGRKPPTGQHAELVEALKSLGLAATAEEIGLAIREVFPDGTEGTSQGEVIKAVFLHLRRRK